MTTLATEVWTGTTGAAWPAQWTTSGTTSINANRGAMTTTAATYTASVGASLSGMTATRDIDVTVDITFANIDEQYWYLFVRSSVPTGASTPSDGYAVDFYPGNGTASCGVSVFSAGNETALASNLAGGQWVAGTAKRVRFQAIGNTIQLKIWDPAGAEPGTWLYSTTNAVQSAATGKVSFVGAVGAPAAARTAYLDNLTVTDGAASSSSVTMTGVVATSAAVAPAGSVSVARTATLAGVLASAASVAPAGSVAAGTSAITNNLTGTTGTTITPANSAGTGNTAFDAVNIGTGNTVAYDTTVGGAANGTSAAKLAIGATVGMADLAWTTAFGTQSTVYGRLYLRVTANPAVSVRIFTAATPGAAALCAGIYLMPDGTLLIVNSAVGNVIQTTNAVNLNGWTRVEFKLTLSATTGQGSISLYKTPDSATATETVTSTATFNMTGAASLFSFGTGYDTKANVGPYWLDEVGLSATAPLGPVAVATTPATLAGVVARSAAAAPAGTVAATRAATLAGPVATSAAVAPAGSANRVLTGVVATVASAAPAGFFVAAGARVMAGVAASSTAVAPAGSVVAVHSASFTGLPPNSRFVAPAGTVVIQVPTPAVLPGVTARVALQAYPGAFFSPRPTSAVLAGTTAKLVATAYAGFVSPDASRAVVIPDDSGFRITVYDGTYLPVGRVGDYISASVTWAWLAPGPGEIVVDADHWLVPVAMTCTTAVVPLVVEVNGVRWSGRVASVNREHTASGLGQATITLVDDWAWLQSILGWPVPTSAIAAQTNAEATYTGPLATAGCMLINDNAVRLGLPVMAIAPAVDTSPTTTISARMAPVADYLVPQFTAANWSLTAKIWLPGDPTPLGYYPLHGASTPVTIGTPSGPTVLIYALPNVSKPWVRWSDSVGGVITDAVSAADPKGYRQVVGGSGNDVNRVFAEVVDTGLASSLGSFGLPEVFLSASTTTDTDVVTQLVAQAVANMAVTSGQVAVQVTVQDGIPWTFGTHYVVGDMPHVELAGVSLVDKPVTSVTATDDPRTGLVITPTIGDGRMQTTSDAMIVDVVQRIAAQLRQLQTGK